MAERKFAALADLRHRPDPAEPFLDYLPSAPEVVPEPAPFVTSPPPAPLTPIAVAPKPAKGRGRPPGKRSDPDWAPRTILMRSKIHRRVSIMLIERDDGPDLSELIDQLLIDWISNQS